MSSDDQSALVERLRHLFAGEESVREVAMFGGRAFMIDEKLTVSAQKDGNLLVRVDPTDSAKLLREPGAHQAEMGRGRSMGPSWIDVSREALDDESLARWVGRALAARSAST